VLQRGAAVQVSAPGAPGASTESAEKRARTRAARAQRQRTIARSIVLGGQGLHTGLRTGVILHPAPPGHGIVFSSLADESVIAVAVENVADTGYNTTIASGARSVRTIEHLLSALHGFGITNLLVKSDEEVPALDGSALEFCRQLKEAGLTDQGEWCEPIEVGTPIVIGDERGGGEFIKIEPAERLIIDYTLEYPAPIGRQMVHFEMTSPEAYIRDIAPARTFGFVREFTKLAEMGLASGGRLDNVILVDDQKVVNTRLRFADEFARHKVLDLIGDLYLLGRPILGHVTASRTGHSDNLQLVKAIQRSLEH
jgi:UDP-3-O-acyl N-acetylglucosamine deacetylase